MVRSLKGEGDELQYFEFAPIKMLNMFMHPTQVHDFYNSVTLGTQMILLEEAALAGVDEQPAFPVRLRLPRQLRHGDCLRQVQVVQEALLHAVLHDEACLYSVEPSDDTLFESWSLGQTLVPGRDKFRLRRVMLASRRRC